MYARIGKYMNSRPEWNIVDVEMPEAPGMSFPLYYRCPIECAKELLANPSFKDDMDYAPEEIFNKDGSRVYHEIATGDIWNELQVSLCSSSMPACLPS